jgi:hypothetical protein
MMLFDGPELERRILAVTEAVTNQLPAQDLENVRSLTKAGEYGVAFDILTTQLEEYEVSVSQR